MLYLGISSPNNKQNADTGLTNLGDNCYKYGYGMIFHYEMKDTKIHFIIYNLN